MGLSRQTRPKLPATSTRKKWHKNRHGWADEKHPVYQQLEIDEHVPEELRYLPQVWAHSPRSERLAQLISELQRPLPKSFEKSETRVNGVCAADTSAEIKFHRCHRWRSRWGRAARVGWKIPWASEVDFSILYSKSVWEKIKVVEQ